MTLCSILFILLLVLLVCQAQQIPGGWNAVAVDNAEVVQNAEWAVAQTFPNIQTTIKIISAGRQVIKA